MLEVFTKITSRNLQCKSALRVVFVYRILIAESCQATIIHSIGTTLVARFTETQSIGYMTTSRVKGLSINKLCAINSYSLLEGKIFGFSTRIGNLLFVRQEGMQFVFRRSAVGFIPDLYHNLSCSIVVKVSRCFRLMSTCKTMSIGSHVILGKEFCWECWALSRNR